jgi:choline-sulfatase
LYPRPGFKLLAQKAGAGDSPYSHYDHQVCEQSIKWLKTEAPKNTGKPWILFVCFYRPHFPLIAPEPFFNMYPLDRLPFPFQSRPKEIPNHPILKTIRDHQNYADYFAGDENIRRALAAYYGMVTSIDEQVGRILTAVKETGLAEKTRIFYTSDHGDNLGNRGFWGKSNMYEDSVGIPLLMVGADIPNGLTVDTPVSLVDFYQTFVEGVGVELTDQEKNVLPGYNLIRIVNESGRDRMAFSEYHAFSAITGIFMVRFDRWKYVHYEGYEPQLFDLETDPLEARDLAQDPDYQEVVAQGGAKLRKIINPTVVTEQAFTDQETLIEKHGGIEAILNRGSLPYTPVPGDKKQMLRA